MFIVCNMVNYDVPIIDSLWNTENEANSREKELNDEMDNRGQNSKSYGWEVREIPMGEKNLFFEVY